jgi:uncharacterized membrane protein YhaH (DUF805 family)
MSSVNPYSPPRAAVDDIESAVTEFQDVKLWSAQGRIGRLRFLAWGAIAYLLLLASILVSTVGAMGSSFLGIVMTIVLFASTVGYILFAVLLAIKRAHDMGWSGWSIFALFIPLVAFVWIFNPGSKGANQFGAPPPPTPLALRIVGLGTPILVIVIGILAAVSLPAYQDYQARAKAKAAIAR